MQLNSTHHFKFDNATTHRQARFGYGPLLGILLANLLSNSAIAKFSPLGAFKISYDPVPWSTHNKPSGYGSNTADWSPLNNPYGPPPSTSISETTESQHVHHHHHISPLPNQQQIVNINGGRPPTEIIIGGDYDTNDTDNPDMVTETNSQSSVIEEDSYLASVKTNLETPRLVDTIAEESRLLPIRELTTIYDELSESQKEKKSVKRGAPNRYYNNKRNRYSTQKRRRYTTTPDYYDYDSDEEFTTTSRYKPKKRTKPKRPIDSYEESTEDYEYDSYEFTTKPYKKRRRTTTPKSKKNKTKTNKKPQKVVIDSDEDDNYENIQQVTHVIEIRQRQQESTTPETTITNGTTITTTTTTTTTESTTTTEAANKTGYGYGPSNGNENISITYGPPQDHPQGVYGPPISSYGPPNSAYGPPRPVYGPPLTGQYQIPYNDWHGSHESGSNAIVRKINDILEFDNVFQ